MDIIFWSPFPGLRFARRWERYDLEILTDDWTRYDANSAIVRTSGLSPEEMNRFVADFECMITRAWEEMVRGYHDKTNTPGIDMQVEGHFRMKLVYRLLSEDLIEKWGEIPASDFEGSRDRLEEELCRRIEDATGVEGGLIRGTIRGFVKKGYIRAVISGGECRWHWTHNTRVDRLNAEPGSSIADPGPLIP
jgi:anaerobic magnesium-protoporphyrin IX monomethyl ester cyclase